MTEASLVEGDVADPVEQLSQRPGRREELARDLVGAAYLRGDFVLSSGRRSNYYFDKYRFETKPTILRRVAALLGEYVPGTVDRLAGPELGAVALATAVSLETGIPFVILRKAAKGYGSDRLVEGEVHAGERILVVEDVVTTGAQAIAGANQVRRLGASVEGILAVLDREEGGASNVAAAGYAFQALFTRKELGL